MIQSLGAIYTPKEFADFLSSWAIGFPEAMVLDLGTGEGVFAFSVLQKLVELGVEKHQASEQIFGAEIDKETFARFREKAKQQDIVFPHIQQIDFFEANFPKVDAIVGNPPYVRRRYFSNEQVDEIRQKVFKKNPLIREADLSHLADLYIYFLLYTLPSLKVGGKLAVIVGDSWLNVRYGQVLKSYLQENFEIERLISLDRRVFDNVQVKPVLLLATRQKNSVANRKTYFTRVLNGLSISSLNILHNCPETELSNVSTIRINVGDLDASDPWAVYFKAPEIKGLVENHKLMVPISHIAQTRIGIQTLAKDFFALSSDKLASTNIEPEYLEPLAHSIAHFDAPVITQSTNSKLQLFYCSKHRVELEGTKAMEYILYGESKEVMVRGKNGTVVGYQNKKRIIKANRPNWYDLRTDVERRGRGPILIPRLIYEDFKVLWNRANFIPGGAVVEFLPKNLSIDTRVYLAILSSSLMEVLLRMSAQVYGGGTYNIGLRRIKEVLMIDISKLSDEQKENLIESYEQYLRNPIGNRHLIDNVVSKILNFDSTIDKKIKDVLLDLHLIATSAKKDSSHPQFIQ